jgi:DNA-binding PadR family transcriptional regulator
MGEGHARKRAAPMRSLVNWALLGLVIDRPSYAYELAQRFDRTYENAIALSSVSHVYIALTTLEERGFVDEIEGTRVGRQPRPHYRATEAGLEAYRDSLVQQISEDRQRQRLFVLELGAFARLPEIALDVIDQVERSCLAEAANAPLPDVEQGAGSTALMARLVAEENRRAIGAKLAWAQYARQSFKALRARE